MTSSATIASYLAVTPQAQKVYKHLKDFGSITPMEAMITYGITRLAARICELRDVGFDIFTSIHRDAVGKPYGRYSLEG